MGTIVQPDWRHRHDYPSPGPNVLGFPLAPPDLPVGTTYDYRCGVVFVVTLVGNERHWNPAGRDDTDAHWRAVNNDPTLKKRSWTSGIALD